MTAENSDKCKFCGSSVQVRARKCKSCGEWLSWRRTPSYFLERLGGLVVLASFLLAMRGVHESQRLQEINAVSGVMARYIEIDRLLLDRPELEPLIVPAEDYPDALQLTKSKEGLHHIQEGQFVAYTLDIFEAEFLLRDYGVYPRGSEFVIDKFLTNPIVIEWWYKEGLRQWYSEGFRSYVESKMAPQVRK